MYASLSFSIVELLDDGCRSHSSYPAGRFAQELNILTKNVRNPAGNHLGKSWRSGRVSCLVLGNSFGIDEFGTRPVYAWSVG